MNWAPMSEEDIRHALRAPVLTPVKRDRLADLTILFWLGFSVASVLYTVAGLIYFLAA